jgi:hypothetical protein
MNCGAGRPLPPRVIRVAPLASSSWRPTRQRRREIECEPSWRPPGWRAMASTSSTPSPLRQDSEPMAEPDRSSDLVRRPESVPALDLANFRRQLEQTDSPSEVADLLRSHFDAKRSNLGRALPRGEPDLIHPAS